MVVGSIRGRGVARTRVGLDQLSPLLHYTPRTIPDGWLCSCYFGGSANPLSNTPTGYCSTIWSQIEALPIHCRTLRLATAA